MMFKTAIFLFRRDLRLPDNTGLLRALHESEQVIPCFFVDPRQVGNKNGYRTMNGIQFMVESLADLEEQLKKHGGRLYFFYGQADRALKTIIRDTGADAVFCNRDYTPFSIQRDEDLEHECRLAGVTFTQCNDALLNEPENIATSDGTPYQTFTPFFNKACKVAVAEPSPFPHGSWYTQPIVSACASKELYKKIVSKKNRTLHVSGGRAHGEKILKSLKKFERYAIERDIPSKETTHLSAHLKFGVVSPREVYHAIKKTLGTKHPLIVQLYWRDFFTHVAFHSPFVFGRAGDGKYDAIHWNYNKKRFKAWCDGKTGVPIVDAGMRQLNATGFMPNRVRMIIASYLVKDLFIDWRWGEQYFAKKLVDYDPAVNNGNWQWVASTGTCCQPYFRIFNPWLQQKKFDPDATYIKTWVPELRRVNPRKLHTIPEQAEPVSKNYPLPLVDHDKTSKRAKELFRRASVTI